ncbi:hypothetical protein BSK59_15435 [Paenibacillus odorifer]|uniref:hypothetical protein n=1 Tax=Paenibacillus odorifer TaxID=189426 RepID=UPI00096E1F51|nr:hypothetical protein [Paenibacillus odorifer]OME53972.1 hypothetical protein BSK59_15435 [Paenibacillus odorifer]
MNRTTKLGLNKPLIDDDIEQTLSALSRDMQIIDDVYDEIIADIHSHLITGKVYPTGQKFWNRTTAINTHVGWINLRNGVYARPWQNKKVYSVGDLITPNKDNGHYYECITGGTSGLHEPSLTTVTGNAQYDTFGSSEWISQYNYRVDDIVVATNNSKLYYYKCIQQGITGNFEPNWSNVSGSTVLDGSVTWLVIKTVQWREKGASCNFQPFGYIGEYYKGQETINTVGTINTGTWNGTTVAIANGGTGGVNAKEARSNIGATGKYSVNIGDGLNTSFTIKHNLDTQDVVIMVRESTVPKSSVPFNVEIIDNNSVLIKLGDIIPTNKLRVTIVG